MSAFLILFAAIVSFILLTWLTESVVLAWATLFLGIVGWAVLLMVAKFVNRDFLKPQKKLNKMGWYVLQYESEVTNGSGGYATTDDKTYKILHQGLEYVVTGLGLYMIGDCFVRETSNIRKSRICLLFNKDGSIDVFTATTRNATLTSK